MNQQPNRDCFAYERKNGRETCGALNALYCQNGGRCRFYKTEADTRTITRKNRYKFGGLNGK